MQNLPRPRTPQTIFDRVAPYYDTFNSALSFGLDRSWRRHAAQRLDVRDGRVLDVATGTGTLALELARRGRGRVQVTGCDINENMLGVARERVAASGLPIELLACDASSLPFPTFSFDGAAIAFAIDDMPDRAACAREIHRVLKPRSRLVVLELAQPDPGLLLDLYRSYLNVFDLLERVTGGYGHLRTEIMTYRGVEAIRELLTEVGFVGHRVSSLAGGVARLHLAEKA